MVYAGNSSTSSTLTWPGACGVPTDDVGRLADPQRDEPEGAFGFAQRDVLVALLDDHRGAQRHPGRVGDRAGHRVAVRPVDLDGHAGGGGDQLERRQLLRGLQVDQQALGHLRRGRRVDLRGPAGRGVAVDRQARVAEGAGRVVVGVVGGRRVGVEQDRWFGASPLEPPVGGARRRRRCGGRFRFQGPVTSGVDFGR